MGHDTKGLRMGRKERDQLFDDTNLVLLGGRPPVAFSAIGDAYLGIRTGIDGERYFAPHFFLPEYQARTLHILAEHLAQLHKTDHLFHLAEHIVYSIVRSAYETAKETNIVEIAKRVPELDFFEDCMIDGAMNEAKLIDKIEGTPDYTEDCFQTVRQQLLKKHVQAAIILKECRMTSNQASMDAAKTECGKYFGKDGDELFSKIFPKVWDLNSFGSAARITTKTYLKESLSHFDNILAKYVLHEHNTVKVTEVADFLAQMLRKNENIAHLAEIVKAIEHQLKHHEILPKPNKKKRELFEILVDTVGDETFQKLLKSNPTIIVTDQGLKETILDKPWYLYCKDSDRNELYYYESTNSFVVSKSHLMAQPDACAKVMVRYLEKAETYITQPSDTQEKQYQKALDEAEERLSIQNFDLGAIPRKPPRQKPVNPKLKITDDDLNAVGMIPELITKAESSDREDMKELARKLTLLTKALNAKKFHKGIIETILQDILNDHVTTLFSLHKPLPFTLTMILENINTPHCLTKTSKILEKAGE